MTHTHTALTDNELYDLVYADPPLSITELRHIVFIHNPDTWANDNWDWKGSEEHIEAYSEFLHRLISALPDDTSPRIALKITQAYDTCLFAVSDNSKAIGLGLFQSFLNRHVAWIKNLIENEVKFDYHPDVPISAEEINSYLEKYADALPVLDIFKNVHSENDNENWQRYSPEKNLE
ncbi:MAG: hypothetical protein J6M18_06890 [Actinomycetaceae bacterium]|nr:hypothetical protein [Actinomycetaceae bacterium]